MYARVDPSGDRATYGRGIPPTKSGIAKSGTDRVKRTTAGATVAGRSTHAPTATTAAVIATAAALTKVCRRPDVFLANADDAGGFGVFAASAEDWLKTNSATEMSPARRCRSFARHPSSKLRMLGDTAGGRRLQSGSARNTAASVSETSSPSNARL